MDANHEYGLYFRHQYFTVRNIDPVNLSRPLIYGFAAKDAAVDLSYTSSSTSARLLIKAPFLIES